MLSGSICINVHYLCSLPSPSGSDPEWSSNDEPGPLSRNPTPSHQPHCQQDSRCQVGPVPQVTLSPFPDSLHDWQVYQHIRIMLTLQCFGPYLISPFDSLKSGCSIPHISLDQSRSLQTSAQSLIRAKAPDWQAWCDMNNWSQTLSFFNGMTKHTDWLSCCETFISWASETGRPSGTAC